MDWKWNITDTTNLGQYSVKILEMYESSYKDIGLIDYGGWDGLKNYKKLRLNIKKLRLNIKKIRLNIKKIRLNIKKIKL